VLFLHTKLTKVKIKTLPARFLPTFLAPTLTHVSFIIPVGCHLLRATGDPRYATFMPDALDRSGNVHYFYITGKKTKKNKGGFMFKKLLLSVIIFLFGSLAFAQDCTVDHSALPHTKEKKLPVFGTAQDRDDNFLIWYKSKNGHACFAGIPDTKQWNVVAPEMCFMVYKLGVKEGAFPTANND
jgi:hypothetical protein